MDKSLNSKERKILDKLNYRLNLIIDLEKLLERRNTSITHIDLDKYSNYELEYLLIKETQYNLVYNQLNLN